MVSSFLSKLVSRLLKPDPQKRPTAEEILLRLNEERNKGIESSKPQYQEPVEKDHEKTEEMIATDKSPKTESSVSASPQPAVKLSEEKLCQISSFSKMSILRSDSFFLLEPKIN